MSTTSCSASQSFNYIIGKQSTCITLQEDFSGVYGGTIWPSAKILSNLIVKNEHLFLNSTVLELGCGPGLPGIVAAKCGSHVYLTDMGEPSVILDNCKLNCEINDVQKSCTVMSLYWGQITKQLDSIPSLDFVLGADIFYDSHQLDALLCTLTFIKENNAHCSFIFIFPERISVNTLQHYLSIWEFPYTLDYYRESETTEQMVILHSNLPSSFHFLYVCLVQL